MKLHYSGPIDRVSVALPNGREAEVAKGQDIDFRDEALGLSASDAEKLEKGLLRQDTWREADDKPAVKPAAKKEG